jgi:hypothetical protein
VLERVVVPVSHSTLLTVQQWAWVCTLPSPGSSNCL